MGTDTAISQQADASGVAAAVIPVAPDPPSAGSRARRRARRRSRRGLVGAILICAGVPSAVVLSLWSNLTEPFWFNEQWRAFYISDSGNWWATLKGDGAPFPAGWYFLERFSSVLFGSTELALRLPTAAFVPIGCVLLLLLGRRWMPTPAAVVVALLATLTGTLLCYGIQVSEYQIDAAAAVAVVLLHEIVWDVERPTWRSLRIPLAYAGIAFACVGSTPAIFLAAPLLTLDALQAAWRRNLGPHLVGSVAAGMIVLAHLAFFVLPQSARVLRSSSYWNARFLPHHGIGSQVAFVWDGVRGFVPGAFTGSTQGPLGGPLIGRGWGWALTLTFGMLLCVGVVEAARTIRGRTILFALVASQVLTLIASFLRYWPFGFVRTNLYLLPLLVLLAGIGAVRTSRCALSWVRGVASRPATGGAARVPRFVVGLVAFALIAAAVALATTDEVGAYRQFRASPSVPQYGSRIGSAVATVRSEAHPGAAVVVTGAVMTTPGWRYYEYEYSGQSTRAGRQIAASHVEFPPAHGSSTITGFVDRLQPGQVFLYVPEGSTGSELGLDIAAIARGRVCQQVASAGFERSGLLVTLRCADR